MDIVVLCGGLSTERDVSRKSGQMVAAALRENGHRAVTVDVYLGIRGTYSGPEEIFSRPAEESPAQIPLQAPDLGAVARESGRAGACRVGDGVLDICRAADLVFLGLHGGDGEDGRLQAMLDIYGVRYTGSGHLASACAMDKETAKRLMAQAGVRVAEGRIVDRSSAHAPAPFLPCVVKPRAGGSSVGTDIARTEEEYVQALENGFACDRELLVERYIRGREIDVGVLGGQALPPIEIRPKDGFFDYKNKYQDGAALELCPVPGLGRELDAALRETALRVWDALGLEVYARMDFIVDAEGQIWCLEANTLPGMTASSLFPKEALAAGMDYGTLCQRILEESLRRYEK